MQSGEKDQGGDEAPVLRAREKMWGHSLHVSDKHLVHKVKQALHGLRVDPRTLA